VKKSSNSFVRIRSKELAEYLKDTSRRGYHFGLWRVRRLAYQLAAKHEISGLRSAKTGMTGRYWFKHLIGRFPELSHHKPEGLSVARAMCCNEQVITQWHATYKETG